MIGGILSRLLLLKNFSTASIAIFFIPKCLVNKFSVLLSNFLL